MATFIRVVHSREIALFRTDDGLYYWEELFGSRLDSRFFPDETSAMAADEEDMHWHK